MQFRTTILGTGKTAAGMEESLAMSWTPLARASDHRCG